MHAPSCRVYKLNKTKPQSFFISQVVNNKKPVQQINQSRLQICPRSVQITCGSHISRQKLCPTPRKSCKLLLVLQTTYPRTFCPPKHKVYLLRLALVLLNPQFFKENFHLACENGHSKIAEMLIQKSAELNIDLNAKYRLFDRTAFHLACQNGHFIKLKDFLSMQNPSFSRCCKF